MPFPSLASSKKFLKPHPIFLVQNNKIMIEPKGRITLLTMKSSRSNTTVPLPSGLKFLSTLKPNTQGIEPIRTIKKLMAHDFFRFQPKRSVQQAMIFSNTAITVESEAKVINKKNNAPQILPPDIELNTGGKVSKIKAEPGFSGMMPNEKHAGNIISPADMATKVSSPATVKASDVRVRSFDI